jgi:hypothetical protein
MPRVFQFGFYFRRLVHCVVRPYPQMANYVQIVGLRLIGLHPRGANVAVIRFLRIWIWVRIQFVQIVQVAVAHWIVFGLHAYMMTRRVRRCCRSNTRAA